MKVLKHAGLILVGLFLFAAPASAGTRLLTDPTGDDFGPGTYRYPTHADYRRGTFDLRAVAIKTKGSKVEFSVTISAPVADPWDSRSWGGHGFSLQMIQIYIDTDNVANSGFTETLPGINATFAPMDAWDRVVMVSPQPNQRIAQEVAAKAPKMKGAVVLPTKVTVRGKTITVVVKKSALGGAPKATWGIQAVMQSNEGYPDRRDLLSRKVNEFPGQHRFGGGNDWECDPHVLDILVAPARGTDEEIAAQKSALAYECGPDGQTVRGAVLPMVR
jgi:carbohydrate-binding DOMON domain-containing protein